MNTEKKPQLHVSMIEMACEIAFQRRYGERFDVGPEDEIIPPGVNQVTGIAVHKSVEDNLRCKMETGRLQPREQVADTARDAFMGEFATGMLFTEEEAKDAKQVVANGVAQTIALAALHHENLAPTLKPLAVEEKFVIALKGYPYDLSGKIDLREKRAISDVKTLGQSPPENAAKSLQMCMYSLAEVVRTKTETEPGKLPEKVQLQCLIKTKTPKIVIREAIPDKTWINPLMRRIERFTEVVQSVKEGRSQFMPVSTTHPWACTEKYCGYARSCQFWSGR